VRSRTLDWEACRNARDLGGLPLRGGGETRFGAIARSDTLRQLTPAGWASLTAYGVQTVVDLRLRREIEADEPLDAGPGGLSRPLGAAAADGVRPAQLRTVVVSVLGEPDPKLGEHIDAISRAQPDEASSTRAVYLELLGRFPQRFAAAIAAVADSPEGAVLVHCHAGKDRTGLVVALLLGVADAEPEAIAADYTLSGPNIASSLAAWVDDGEDPDEREHRRRVGLAPEQAMLDVLAELDTRYGGTTSYLLAAGLTDDDLVRVSARLTGPSG
jgi:protein-tyrosine phosphatase